MNQSSRLILRAGGSYFAMVFGAGFVLGSIRVPFLVPRLGERTAELLEAPIMLGLIFFISRFVVRRFSLAAHTSIFVGLLALVLLISAELMLGVALGRSVTDRDPISGSIFLASLGLYAALPWLHARSRGSIQP